jgi:hypothetical protein
MAGFSAAKSENPYSSADNAAAKPGAEAQSGPFCIDVIAEAWGKKHDMPPAAFKEQQKVFLGFHGPDDAALNKMWEDMQKDVYAKSSPGKSAADADEFMKKFQDLSHCL